MKLTKPVIITSRQCMCGRNLREALLKNFPFKATNELFDGTPIYQYEKIRLIESEKDVLFTNYCDSLKADLLLFGSRHKSESNKPSLLTHVTGNLGNDNSHGGNPFELAFACTRAIRSAYFNLLNEKEKLELKEFDVTVEATHHGPTNMKTPLIFIEVGSTEIEYQNQKAILAVVKTLMNICMDQHEEKIIPSICFGGGHYASLFNEAMNKMPIAIGHILPKYHKQDIKHEIVEQMINKTIEKVKWAIFDKSSLNNELISIIRDVCSTYEIEAVKIKDLMEKNK